MNKSGSRKKTGASPQPRRAEKPHLIQSVAKALRILDVFTREDPDLSLQQVAGRLGLSQNTVFPILQTLTAFGYLKKDPFTRHYRLGLKLLERSGHLREFTELVRVADPHLTSLSETTRENTHLAVLDRGEVVFLDRKEGSEPLMIQSRVGKRVPPHCTALGKVLLAGLPSDELEALLVRIPLTAVTRNTITDRHKFRLEIARVRDRGYALDKEEHQEGGVCIGGPVLNAQGQVLAAASVSLPAIRCDPERLERLRARVLETCRAISRDLGYISGSDSTAVFRG